MAHIANKIDAKDKKLSEILTNQRYKIDAFQREYRWQWKQIEALISDLSISFLKNYEEGHTIKNKSKYDCYYMGPIVLCEEDDSLSIVDGQQRLTSFTLLLIHLHHLQSLFDLPQNSKKDIKSYIYVTKDGETTLVLNVATRNKVLEHLFKNPETIYDDLRELEESALEIDMSIGDNKKKITDLSVQNIIDRYEDITKLFPTDINKVDVLPIFIEWLLDKVVMVEIKAYSMANAYTIFETMNDRGLSLNPTEILKGYLISKIDDESKGEEVNEFWRERIAEVKTQIAPDADLDFFRAWLRAKYAETIRVSKVGAENEDFELVGTQFHTWIKNNPSKMYLDSSNDYYFFIRSDFDFFSNLYKSLYEYKNKVIDSIDELYVTSFYPIADSLAYPLYMSPVSKIDDDDTIIEKLLLVNLYIDIFTNSRMIEGKAITQSTIRNSMYELIKTIRDTDLKTLKTKLISELEKSKNDPYQVFTPFHTMDNWSYYHYFFARILFHLNASINDFRELLRSKRHNSLVLTRIFDNVPQEQKLDAIMIEKYYNSVANFCLVRRYDFYKMEGMLLKDRIAFLAKENYLPEMGIFDVTNQHMQVFIELRDGKIRELVKDIWKFS